MRRVPEGAALGVVTGLLFLNQLCVVVYVRRVHGGDPGFVARWLPDGWFELPRWEWLDALAMGWPWPELLAPSVLRVPALLELPFVLLAYLVVAGFVGGGNAVGSLLRPGRLWAASVVWTVAFAWVEWHYRNPWTTVDLVLRFVACVATPLAVSAWVRAPHDGDRGARSAGALLAGAVSAACLGGLVLVVYDTALLYNLARLPGQAWLGVVLGVALGAGLGAVRLVSAAVERSAGEPGPAVAWLGRLASAGTVAFFVPALAVRYGMTFGARGVSVVVALLVCGVALWRSRPTVAALVRAVPIGIVAAAGGLGAVVAARPWLPGYYEARLLVWLGVAVMVTLVGCALADRVPLLGGRGRR